MDQQHREQCKYRQGAVQARLSQNMMCYVVVAPATGQAAAKPGLQALMDSCQARQPQLVEQMVSMMTELEHMSVLWTEQWHIALLELQVIVQPYDVASGKTLELYTPSIALSVSRIKYRHALLSGSDLSSMAPGVSRT